MGGRGRDIEHQDRWDWVKELPNDRLERYGKMSAYKVDTRTDYSKEALNFECANEYKRRHGHDPKWKR